MARSARSIPASFFKTAFTTASVMVASAMMASACGGSEREMGPSSKGSGAPAASGPGQFAGDPSVNPNNPGAPFVCAPSAGNYEVPGNGCDDDADGNVDNVVPCDGALPVSGDAATFVKALGLCKSATATSWGLVSAKYSRGYNTNADPHEGQHGILTKFGDVVKPREGISLGVLSTGYAREFDKGDGPGSFDPLIFFPGLASHAFKGGQRMTGDGALPPGYPKAAAGCTIANDVHDVASIELEIKVPTNARGLKFDFNFYSGEWPEYVCTQYNDGFAAFLRGGAFNGGVLDNISFDAMSNPVSVNNGFFDRCTPNAQTGCQGGTPKIAACPGGESELAGTGFAEKGAYCGDTESSAGGATGWLTSQAPVQPGETITLQFVIWDTGDERYDSSVLLDNLAWEQGPTDTKTERPK